MKKFVFAAALVAASIASSASAKTVLVETFPGGAASTTTLTGNVGVANGATYAPCCGTPSTYLDYFAALGGGNLPSGTITATFNTVLGKIYTFSFDQGTLGGGSEILSGTVGATSFSFNGNANNSLPAFASHSISFIGQAGTTSFLLTSEGKDNVDSIVDNLRVSTVPEPAIWGMMILGFGAIGATLRRRKSVLAFA